MYQANQEHSYVIYLWFYQESTAKEIVSQFQGEQADLVVCDGAPDGKPT